VGETTSWQLSQRLAILFGMSDVTRILSQIELGDPQAAGQLLPLVYDELRRLAAARLAHEKPGQTLGVTSLVHEAYLRLVGSGKKPVEGLTVSDAPEVDIAGHQSRGHFFAAAAEAMRRILVEQARRKHRIKRGGDRVRVQLDVAEISVEPPSDEILALDEALARLEAHDKQKADVVKLRYFAGLTIEDTAAALGISTPTVKRYWAYARAWLLREISKGER
jgi:RNA polymerase sigma factor (sigma-70 family)